MPVVSLRWRTLVGIVPKPRCFTARWCRSRGRWRIIVHLAVVIGLVNIAWVFFAAPEDAAAASAPRGPDRAPQGFDDGIKLDFHAENRSVLNGKTRGDVNIAGLEETRGSHNGRISKEAMRDTYPPWCSGRGTGSMGPHPDALELAGGDYFLTAVLLVRIYADDLAKLTTREMVQWLQYLSYAGVEHVYVYDAYLYKNESQREQLRCFIENGFVTYVDWSHRARPKYTIAGTQVSAYQDCLSRFGRHFAWQTAIDIDEYPFCPGDHAPGFLSRAVRELTRSRGDVGEISMQNDLYLGKPLNDSEHPLLIDRLWRRTIKRANALVKPIYRPKGVSRANVHHNSLNHGYVNYSPSEQKIRMNHYWGARLQGWGDDTPEVLNMTMEDRGMERAVLALTPCVKGCQTGCC